MFRSKSLNDVLNSCLSLVHLNFSGSPERITGAPVLQQKLKHGLGFSWQTGSLQTVCTACSKYGELFQKQNVKSSTIAFLYSELGIFVHMKHLSTNMSAQFVLLCKMLKNSPKELVTFCSTYLLSTKDFLFKNFAKKLFFLES